MNVVACPVHLRLGDAARSRYMFGFYFSNVLLLNISPSLPPTFAQPSHCFTAIRGVVILSIRFKSRRSHSLATTVPPSPHPISHSLAGYGRKKRKNKKQPWSSEHACPLHPNHDGDKIHNISRHRREHSPYRRKVFRERSPIVIFDREYQATKPNKV